MDRSCWFNSILNQSDVNELYKKYLGREGDFNTTGGASYWSDKVGTSGHSLAEIENALNNNFSSSAIDNVTISSKDLNSDIHASSEYRAHLIKIMAKRAVEGC